MKSLSLHTVCAGSIAAMLGAGAVLVPNPVGCAPLWAQDGGAGQAGPVIDLSANLDQVAKPSDGQVSIAKSTDPAAPGYVVTIAPGEAGYPGITLNAPEGQPFDLSAFGRVEAKVTNLSTKNAMLALRLDNPGNWKDNPWNTENQFVKPGATVTLKTIFGYSYGKPAYKLDGAKVSSILLFTGKVTAEQKFLIHTLQAAGAPGDKPPVDPNSIRTVPPGGVLLSPATALDVAKNITQRNATATLADGKGPLKIDFGGGNADKSITLKPEQGRWNLRDSLQLRVQLRNAGTEAVWPRVRIDTNGGNSDWASPTEAMAAGAKTELVIPFSGNAIWNGNEKGSGPKITSNTVSGITIGTIAAAAPASVMVDLIRAEMPPQPTLPAWLGKRPPVEGEWTQTLNENFDGDRLDDTVWNNEGPNFWDKISHWSKEEVKVANGKVALSYRKKTGKHNDKEDGKETPYAGGYLDSYGKWVQRYGYFESRMKLPTAPGLWPAFWMMPDRGAPVGEQWKRQDTANGGMELDIMEHLTRWGPNRYNVAMHYDGYGKGHKALGTDKIYMQPDAEGYITTGVLWTPGVLVYYCNGLEVGRWESERVSNVQSNFLFTLPQGGWDNDPVDDSRWPAEFVLDYVRVWQRKDLASAVDGKQNPVAPAAPAAG